MELRYREHNCMCGEPCPRGRSTGKEIADLKLRLQEAEAVYEKALAVLKKHPKADAEFLESIVARIDLENDTIVLGPAAFPPHSEE